MSHTLHLRTGPIIAGTLIAASLATCSVATAQELVANGSFESPVVTGPWVQRQPNTTFGNWHVDAVGQGIVQVASFGSPLAFDGHQCVELNFYQACGISQTLTTIPGQKYTLSFLLAGQINAGPDRKDMRIDWNGATLATVSWSRSGSGSRWEGHEFIVTATSTSTVLHFFGLTDVDGGPYLDAVSVTPGCLADFNDDGGVDGADVSAFFAAWESGSDAADLNQDGGIDGADVQFFFSRWEAGC